MIDKANLRSRLPNAVYRSLVVMSRARPSHRRWLRLQTKVAQQRALLDDEVVRLVGTNAVQSGPFAGASLSRSASWGLDFSARLLGTYEMELHPALSRMLLRPPPVVIDVGCADGYYVAGFGRAVKTARLVGYDIDHDALKVTGDLARMNDCADRLTLFGLCRPEDLESQAHGSIIVMDCEGAEADLITPAVISSNQNTRFVIECHEHLVPGISARLQTLFEGRDVEVVMPRPREAADAPSLPPELANQVLDEMRAFGNPWLVVH